MRNLVIFVLFKKKRNIHEWINLKFGYLLINAPCISIVDVALLNMNNINMLLSAT